MPKPPVEVTDVIRAAGESFFECSQKWFTWLHLKALNAILRCRTAALGGHVDACSKCGHTAISYNSCRNRHCPKCQANARDLCPFIPGQRRDAASDRPRSEASRRRDRVLQRPPHLEPETPASSSRSLCGSRRRVVSGPFAVDRLAAEFLPAG